MIQNITQPSAQIVNPNGIPVSSKQQAPSGRFLEVRLNSIDEAKAAVQNQLDILATVKKFGFDGIEFLIAREIEQPIQAVIGGVFNCKTIYGRVNPRAQNVHYPLPAFKDLGTSKGVTSVGRPAEQVAVPQTAAPEAELDAMASKGSEWDDTPAAPAPVAQEPKPRRTRTAPAAA